MIAANARPRKPHLHDIQPRIRPFFAVLAAAAVGWLLTALFVADDWPAGLIAVPIWLAAGALGLWLAERLRDRTREQRLSERRLEGIREGANDAVLRVEADGTIADWSPGAEALYGYSDDELVGRPLVELLGEPNADRIVEAVRSGEPFDEAMQQRRRDGGAFTASVTVVPTGAEPPEAIVVAQDVGELRRVTANLRDTEAKYRSLTEQLPVVTYLQEVDGERRTTFVSPQIDRLVGYTADEWLEDPDLFLRLVHPEDRDEVAAARKAVEAGKGIRSTYRMVARDGRVVWLRDEAVVVLDESGRPRYLQGYLLDVSERKAAEQERSELRQAQAATAEQSAARLRRIELVAETASILASSLDARSTVQKVAGLATRELAEWCVVDVLHEEGTVTRWASEGADSAASAAEPDARPDQGVADVIRGRRPELSQSKISIPLIARGRRPVGALTLLRGEDAAPFGSDDLPWASALAGMIALAIDNSRLHNEVQAQSDANKVLRHIGEGVFHVDTGGLVRLWNPAAATIIGVSADTAVGKPAADVIDDWHELADLVPVGTSREHARAATLPLETEHGERWLSIAGVEFAGGTVYAFRDITEEHQIEELKAEFIATASHELRTPLAAVYGAAQTLRRHDFALDDAGRERFISLIVDESDRLAQIVNQILLANQLEVGRVDLETEPFDAADLVERVVESAKTHAPSNVVIDVRVAPAVPRVAADKDRAQQVLVNLVDNAVKYSPGGGRVEVAVEPAEGAVEFHVSDEGMGIPAKEQPRIFEKFYRLDPNMTKGIGGTGLGLYICSELVQRMGGRIWLESETGEGSRFSFRLPSVGAHPVLPKAQELAERAAPASAPTAQADVGS
ncbi:MAG TPA: PAS domain S-box protein [Gaiellaceae bacterium]|nr:PAS domain S-box protein [Gaiellaceae bacterium]